MKRRISDLLEDIRDDTVELSSETPLSSQRIKELTMSKINKEKKSAWPSGFWRQRRRCPW